MMFSQHAEVDCEAGIPLKVGVVVAQVAHIRRGMDLGMMLTGVPLVVLSRAVNIYPLAYLVNKGEQHLSKAHKQSSLQRQIHILSTSFICCMRQLPTESSVCSIMAYLYRPTNQAKC